MARSASGGGVRDVSACVEFKPGPFSPWHIRSRRVPCAVAAAVGATLLDGRSRYVATSAEPTVARDYRRFLCKKGRRLNFPSDLQGGV